MLGHGSLYSTPRWVKVFGITVIALLLLAAGLHLIGRGVLGDTFSHYASGPTEHHTQQP